MTRAGSPPNPAADQLAELQQSLAATVAAPTRGDLRLDDRFVDLARSMPCAVFVHCEGRFLYMNPAAEGLSGRSATALVADTTFDFIHVDDRETIARRSHGDAANPMNPARHEVRLLRPDGTVCWAEYHACAMSIGGHPALLGVAFDITARKEEAERHRRNESQFRQLADNLDAVVWMTDIETNELLYVSREYERLWGRPLDELRADPVSWRAALHPDDLPQVHEDPASLDPDVEHVSRDYRIVRPDGTVRWVNDRVFVIRDENGRPIRKAGIVTDITARKDAEVELRQREHRYRTIASMTCELAFSYAIDDDGNATRDWTTGSVASLTGWSEEEIEQRGGWASLIHPDDLESLQADFQGARDGHECVGVRRLTTRDGSERTMRITLRPEPSPVTGRIVRVFGAAKDITDRTHAEEDRCEMAVRYQTMVELVSSVAFSYRVDGQERLVLDWIVGDVERLSGFTGAELMERGGYRALLTADQAAEWEQRIRSGGAEDESELQVVRKDGSHRWLRVRLRRQRNPQTGLLERLYGAAVDVTAQHHDDAVLRRNQERYRTVTQMSTSYACSFRVDDRDTVMLEWTAGDFKGITGYDPSELRTLEDWQRAHVVADRAAVAARLDRVLAGECTEAEVQMVRKDGSRRWVHLRTQPVFNSQRDRVTRFYVAAQDITQRRHDEESLREREMLHRSIVDAHPAGLVRLDAEANILLANAEARRLLELDGDVNLLTIFAQRVIDEDGTPVRVGACPVCRCLDGGSPVEARTFGVRRSDGRITWVRINAVRIDADSSTTPHGDVMMTLLDVSDHRRTSSLLRASEERLRVLVEEVGVAVWEFDLTSRRFTFVSGHAESMFGYPLEQWTEPGFWRNALHPEDRNEAIRLGEDAIRRGGHAEFEYRMMRNDGRAVWVKDISSITSDGGRAVAIRGVFVDVTQRKLAEALQEGQNTVLKQLAAGMPRCDFLRTLTDVIEEIVDGVTCMFLLPDDTGAALEALPTTDAPPELLEAVRGLPIGPDQGSCGTAAYTRHPVIVADTATDPRWASHREFAEQFNIRASWSFPVLSSGGRVLATLSANATFSREPTRDERALLESAAQLAGIGIERREADLALRDSEQRFRELAEHVTSIFVLCTADRRRVIYVSPAYERLCGQPCAALYNNPRAFLDVVHRNDRKPLRALLDQPYDGSVVDLEFRIVHPDGHQRWVAARLHPVRPGGTDIQRIAIVASDITQQRQTQEALRRTRFAVDNAGEAMFTADLNGRILDVNETACRRLGYSRTELLERTLVDIMPALGPAPWGRYRNVLRRHGTLVVEAAQRTSKGESIPSEVSFSYFEMEGVSYVCSFARDITERRSAAAEIQRRRDQERLLFRELNHRVRNNLAALLGLVDLAASHYGSVDDVTSALSSRIRAMSSAHSLLSQTHWSAVELADILRSLTPPEAIAEFTMSGPAVLIQPRQVTPLALTLQELVTNSIKHGALSRREGLVSLTWTLTPNDDAGPRTLRATWRERGGPPILGVPTQGTGSRIMHGLVTRELRGELDARFPREGAEVELTVTLESSPGD